MAIFGKLLQRITGKDDAPTVNLVPKRFLQVFREHGIEAAQIPRLFPEIRLEDLQSEQHLFSILNHDLLQKVANYFGVRLEWLEGVDDTIYEHWMSYKCPEKLFEDLAAIPKQNLYYPIRILVNDKKLDRLSRAPQHLVLVVAEKIGELGEQTVERFRIYDSLWDWHHSPCRYQLKAIGRLIHNVLHMPIPIYEVDMETLESISNGERIPRQYIYTGFCPSPCLEDFALTEKESGVAKETEELPRIFQFIQDYGLEEKAKLLDRKDEEVEATPPSHAPLSRQEKAKKAATEKNSAGNEIKLRFIELYKAKIDAEEISQAKAAAEFYDSLEEEQAILLCRSRKDYETSTPDELRIRAIRTLTNAFRFSRKT